MTSAARRIGATLDDAIATGAWRPPPPGRVAGADRLTRIERELRELSDAVSHLVSLHRADLRLETHDGDDHGAEGLGQSGAVVDVDEAVNHGPQIATDGHGLRQITHDSPPVGGTQTSTVGAPGGGPPDASPGD